MNTGTCSGTVRYVEVEVQYRTGTVRYRTIVDLKWYGTEPYRTVAYGTLFGTLLTCAVGVILDKILDIPARARNHVQMQRTVRARYCILKYGTVRNMYLEMFYTKSRVEIKGIL